MNNRRTLTVPGVARWAFILLAIPAIVAGILAMHFLPGLPGTSERAHLMVSPSAAVAADHTMGDSALVIADDCSDDCMPTHEMTAMACLLLFLLLTVLILASTSGSLGWVSPRAMLARISVALSTLAPPHPPSLTALSISRT